MKAFYAHLGTQKATFLARTPCAEEKLGVSHGGVCQNSAFERLRQKNCHKIEASLNQIENSWLFEEEEEEEEEEKKE